MFQKYQPKKPPLNPFEETEEDNYMSPTNETPDDLNPFADDMAEEAMGEKTKNSTNPFEDSLELDDSNPFSDTYNNDSYSSLDRQKKKAAPAPPRSKSQTLQQNNAQNSQGLATPPLKPERKAEKIAKPEDKVKGPEKVHRYIKSPKKKAPGPPQPIYKGTPPPSPEEKRKSRSLTPPPVAGNKEKLDQDSSMLSTPSSA